MTLLFAGLAVAQAQPAAATSASVPATATGASNGTNVGVIDIQQAIGASNEGQRDFGALEKKFEPKRTELSSANTEIDNLSANLKLLIPRIYAPGPLRRRVHKYEACCVAPVPP